MASNSQPRNRWQSGQGGACIGGDFGFFPVKHSGTTRAGPRQAPRQDAGFTADGDGRPLHVPVWEFDEVDAPVIAPHGCDSAAAQHARMQGWRGFGGIVGREGAYRVVRHALTHGGGGGQPHRRLDPPCRTGRAQPLVVGVDPAVCSTHRAPHVIRRVGLSTLLRKAREVQAVASTCRVEDCGGLARG